MSSTPPDSAPRTPGAKPPFFSIVAACCDVAPHLEECFASVLSQPFADWELVAGVETSSDGTEDIVRAHAGRDSRIRMFTGPRTGSCSVLRNRGVALARGDYILFLDGDDSIAPGSLQRLHDLVSARPGADLYPCAIVVREDATGRILETRDNYPADAPAELTGPEATLLTGIPPERTLCPMLQMSVFRRDFLLENRLESIPGLRRQDSEFSPRALYFARRVVPLHEPFYFYRIHAASVSGLSPAPSGFLRDWAVIYRSLLAFHADVSRSPGFDSRLSACWARRWLSCVLVWWFHPQTLASVSRTVRAETLQTLFAGGFGDLARLASHASAPQRVALAALRTFVRHPLLRGAVERFFSRIYFPLTSARAKSPAPKASPEAPSSPAKAP